MNNVILMFNNKKDSLSYHALGLLCRYLACSRSSRQNCTAGHIQFNFLFFAVLGFELKAYTLSHSTSGFCVCVWWVFFEIGSHKLCAWSWLRTETLLIFACWVARITGVSHQCLVPSSIFVKCFQIPAWKSLPKRKRCNFLFMILGS
jgi:hypothetical protein